MDDLGSEANEVGGTLCIRHFFEFALKLGVFIVHIFQFNLNELSFSISLEKMKLFNFDLQLLL